MIKCHYITFRWPDGRRELKGINLVEYGDPQVKGVEIVTKKSHSFLLQGYTAMAKTVGYPCAIATKMVLDGEIQRSGMVNNEHKFILS